MKIDAVVKQETVYIAVISSILMILMQIIAIIIGHWSLSVLLSSILGLILGTTNFFLMGLTIQISLEKEEKSAKKFIQFSQNGRLFLIFVFVLIAYFIPVFNVLAVAIPLLFPRIAIALRPLIIKER